MKNASSWAGLVGRAFCIVGKKAYSIRQTFVDMSEKACLIGCVFLKSFIKHLQFDAFS